MVKNRGKTKTQLMEELAQLRRRIVELEALGYRRNQFEEALRAERDKAQQYLDIAEVILVALNKKGEITLINRKGNQILGYQEGELLGKNWFTTCLPSPFRKDVKAFFLRLMGNKGMITEFYENPVLTKSGAKRIIAWHNTLLKDAQGNNIGTLSSGEDITECKQAEEKLRESEERYKTLFDEGLVGICLADAKTGIIIDCNEAMAALVRRERAELIGRPQNILHPPPGDDNAALSPTFKQHLTDKEGQILETQVVTRTGEIREVEIKANLLDLQGREVLQGLFHDITDRKRAEEALRQSEDKFKYVFDHSVIGKSFTLPSGEINVNRALCKMLGYRREELNKKKWQDITHPDDIALTQKVLDEIASGKKDSARLSKRYIHKNGSIVWGELNTSLRRDRAGKPLYFMSSMVDITARKQAEEALRKSEDKYRTILKNIEEGYYEVDLAGNFTFFNVAMCRIGGHTKEELMGMNYRQYTDKENAKRVFQAFNEVYRTGKLSKGYDYEIIKKDGTKSYVETSISLQKDSSGKAIGFRGIIRDITERKLAVKELRESEERFRLAFENANTGVCLVDLEGNLTRVNAKMGEIFGYTKEELEHMTVNDIALPEDVDLSPEFIQKTLRGEIDRTSFEKRYIHKKGHVVTCEVSSSLVRDEAGTPLYFISHVHDITDRKQAEAQIRESQQRFQGLVETLNDWIWEVDQHGFYTYVSPRIKDLLGYEWKEVLGKTPYDLMPPEEAERVKGIFESLMAKKRPLVALENTNRHKDGRLVIFETSGMPYFDAEGRFKGYRGVDRDITARKKTEETLRERQETINAIIETSQDWIWAIDSQGVHTYSNPAIEKILGYRSDEIVGTISFKLIHDDDKKWAESLVQECREKRRGWNNLLLRWRHKDGTYRYLESNAVPILNHAGDLAGFRGVDRDITDRKLLQKTLDGEREELKLIIDSTPIRVFFKNNEGKYIRVNKTYAEGLKMTEDDIMGKTVFDFYSPRIAQSMTDDDQEVLQSGRPKLNIIEQYESASGISWVQTDKVPIFDKDGNTTGLIGFARDITDRKQSEELIKIRLRLLEFAATHTLAELLQKTLDEVCAFTNSTVGFYHFIEQDQKTLSLQAWSTRTIKEFCKAEGAGMHYSIDQAGVWVDCVRERRPVIHNDYASLPHRKGMPEGHAAIIRELMVPIMRNNRFVAIIGIGNKPQDYTDQDIQVVSYLADIAWEIAERKRAGEALTESEKKYRKVVENATDIIYTTDINGNFKYANSIALKVTGYSLEELQRFNYLDLVVPEYRDQLKEIYGNQFRGGQATTYVEFPFSNKFGKVMWFGQNASLMIEGGRIIGFQVIARDISKRKQAEEALRDSEEKYRDLVENISDIIYATDESGIVTYISPTIKSISGYTPSEIVGRSFLEFVYREDLPNVVQLFQRDISGQAEPSEYRMVTKSCVVRWVRTSSRPFFEGDRIVGLRGILTDITDRKKADEEIKRSYEQLQETLHSTVNALASTVEMKDQYTAGHQPRVTKLACAIAEEMGLPAAQIEGIRMASSIHDIGKIMVPAEILNKPGRLTEIQYEMIKMHPRAGYDILKGLRLPWPVAQIILQHHELMDGTGYPQGLSGEAIMIEARILAVANVVEAMNAHRPYRPAYDIKEALAEISKNRGGRYDPLVVDACLRLFTEKGFSLDPVLR